MVDSTSRASGGAAPSASGGGCPADWQARRSSIKVPRLTGEGYRHEKGWIQAWTGGWSYFNGSTLGSESPSLDQLVAAQIARSDRLPSLELAINGVEDGRPICHARRNQPLPMESSPARAWERLFGPACTPDPLTDRQGSILDFAHREFAVLSPQLGRADRSKLELHFELVRSLEQRLSGMTDISCEGIPEPATSLESYDDTFDAFAELIGVAFSSDITRVVTLSLGDMPTEDFGWGQVGEYHKGLAHEGYHDTDSAESMNDYVAHHAAQISRLIEILESIPDIDGNSVMDNTLIIWGSEMADGWHGYQHYCPLLIGGDWHFNSGRYLHWPHQTPIQLIVPSGQTQYSGMPHQHLCNIIFTLSDI